MAYFEAEAGRLTELPEVATDEDLFQEIEKMGGKSEAASRQVKISPSFARLGMAREDEQFFLLSHSNRKTGQAEKAGRVV